MDQEAENDEERISDNEPTLSATTDFNDLQFILQETRVLLLQQILAHPTGVLSVEELVYRSPDLSEKNIRYHLRELENRGIVEGLEIPKGKRERNLPNTFFTVTEKGLQLLKQTNLYEEVGVWTQVYDQMERTPRIKAIERMENRPENQIIKEEQRTTTESQEVRTCPECDSENLVKSSDRGELICDDCGLVVEEGSINPGPEWQEVNHQEHQQKSRVGAPTTQTMHDKGLATTIDWKDKGAYGRSISSKKRSQMHRLRKRQERIRAKDASDSDLQFALMEIDRMASALGVPRPAREVASVIYRRALKEGLIQGRSIEGVATAALYAACQKEDIPRSLEEISKVSRVERKEIGRTYRYISQELGLEIKPVDPKKYVPRFCSELGLSEEVQSKAIEIIETTAEEGLLSGKPPTGYAAAAIYAASLLCNEKKTQREVADVAHVTEGTLRNRYQEQIEAMGIHG